MSGHVVTRKVHTISLGEQVTLSCSCGRWSAMTVAYGSYNVEHCTRSLLSGYDGVHKYANLSI